MEQDRFLLSWNPQPTGKLPVLSEVGTGARGSWLCASIAAPDLPAEGDHQARGTRLEGMKGNDPGRGDSMGGSQEAGGAFEHLREAVR